MTRSIGIPTRVVLGFTPGTEIAPNEVVVLDNNAHSWVELWIPAVGWVAFDPTPRGDGANPVTSYERLSEALGFEIAAYLEQVPEPIRPDIEGGNPISGVLDPEIDLSDLESIDIGGPAANAPTALKWIPVIPIAIALILLVIAAIPIVEMGAASGPDAAPRRRRHLRRVGGDRGEAHRLRRGAGSGRNANRGRCDGGRCDEAARLGVLTIGLRQCGPAIERTNRHGAPVDATHERSVRDEVLGNGTFPVVLPAGVAQTTLPLLETGRTVPALEVRTDQPPASSTSLSTSSSTRRSISRNRSRSSSKRVTSSSTDCVMSLMATKNAN